MCRLYSQRIEPRESSFFFLIFTTFIDRPQHPSRYIYFHFLCPLLFLHFTIISHPADTHTISCLLFLLLLLLLVPCLLFPIGHERMLLFAFVVDLQQSSFFFFLLLLLRTEEENETMGFVNEFKWLLAPWGRSLASHFSCVRRKKKGTQKFPPRVLKEKWGKLKWANIRVVAFF